MDSSEFQQLEEYFLRIPGLVGPVGTGSESSDWWVKFSVDIKHHSAWNVIQELGHVLNYLFVDERLPTVFKPVSPPPCAAGGLDEFLSWVIECSDLDFVPDAVADWLVGRLPRPVRDLDQCCNGDD